MSKANLKTPTQPNPAFPKRSSRESDELGSEDMFEHSMSSRAVMTVAEKNLVVVIIKRAEFRRTE